MAPSRLVPGSSALPCCLAALWLLIALLGESASAFLVPQCSFKLVQPLEASRSESSEGVARSSAVAGQLAALVAGLVLPSVSVADEGEPLPRLLEGGKPRMQYSDFSTSKTGLQFKTVKEGSGESPVNGDRVVIDWEGYTIGYYGKPFEAKGKVKGGEFAEDKDFYRFILGKNRLIPAIEEAVQFMKPGGIAQLVVPPELGYPADDPSHERVGPKPTTFGGQRTLDFVLQNKNYIDKTLLINVKLIRVDKPGQRGFKG